MPTTEAGDMKLLGNFRREIDFAAGFANYNPPNPDLQLAKLNSQHAAALAAVEAVGVTIAPYKVAVNEREIGYDAVSDFVRRAMSLLRSSGASKEIIADAATYARKLTSRRKAPRIPDNPATPANEADASNSASQMSYDNQLGNLRTFLEILSNEPLYVSNDTDLQIGSLTNFADDLEAKNHAVSSTFVPISNARALRDRLLYNDPKCVVNTALLLKEYAKSKPGGDASLYNQIKSLKFPRQRKKSSR